MYAVGLTDKLPRLVSVQAEGCCPINRAFANNAPIEKMEENTIADSIAVGVPRNGDKALAAIRESGGIAVNVSDDEILAAMRLLGKEAGVFGEPAGVAGTAGLVKAAALKLIPPDATVVSLITGNGLKDVASARKAAGVDNGAAGAESHGALIRIEPDIALLEKEFSRQGIQH
jgi:threonine synthase